MRLMLRLKNSSKDPSVALKDVQTLVFRVKLMCKGCARVRCSAAGCQQTMKLNSETHQKRHTHASTCTHYPAFLPQ